MTSFLRKMNGTLWILQILIAAFLLTGAILKFQPIEKIAPMMPWAGQVPVAIVRLLGVIDLVGAAGLILPAWLRIKPSLTTWAAVGAAALMACAIVFHLSRGEAGVIRVNIIFLFLAVFVAWGRFKKVPISIK